MIKYLAILFVCLPATFAFAECEDCNPLEASYKIEAGDCEGGNYIFEGATFKARFQCRPDASAPGQTILQFTDENIRTQFNSVLLQYKMNKARVNAQQSFDQAARTAGTSSGSNDGVSSNYTGSDIEEGSARTPRVPANAQQTSKKASASATPSSLTPEQTQQVAGIQEQENITNTQFKIEEDMTSSTNKRQEISELSQKYLDNCAPAIKTAQRCCQHPEQCLGESVGADGSQNSMILGTLQTILSAAGQAASLSGACGKMQNVALTVTAVNAALATKCTAKIVKCKQECKSIIDDAKEKYKQCQAQPTKCIGDRQPTAQTGEAPAAFAARETKYREAYMAARQDLASMVNTPNTCEANENYAQNQVNQTIASALTAKTMGLCKEASSNSSSVSAANAAFNVDCSSAANAANPACQNVCNRAGSQNDPACNPNLAGNGYGTGSGTGTSGTNLNGLGGIDELENAQGILTDSVNPNANKAQLGSGAGGGGVGGGGGGLGGFESQAAGGGDAGSGFDPKSVGAGFRSGSGYSAPGGRGLASAGGAGGYSAPAGKPGVAAGQPFNPKDYLPGGRLDPKRKLAGLAATTPEIGAVHGDIFRSITNRFYQICLRDGLYDCATLRRSGTQGN